jgi:hypothetical protein
MEIHENDFVLEPISNEDARFNLRFYKRVKKKDTGQYEKELGDPLYGLTLSSALMRIAHHRVAKKYEEENITLRQFLKEYQLAYNEIVRLCRETLPEDFDTGE